MTDWQILINNRLNKLENYADMTIFLNVTNLLVLCAYILRDMKW